jgi:hypothetical protein
MKTDVMQKEEKKSERQKKFFKIPLENLSQNEIEKFKEILTLANNKKSGRELNESDLLKALLGNIKNESEFILELQKSSLSQIEINDYLSKLFQ